MKKRHCFKEVSDMTLPSCTRRTATNAQLHCQDAQCTCGSSIAEEAKRITADSFIHTSCFISIFSFTRVFKAHMIFCVIEMFNNGWQGGCLESKTSLYFSVGPNQLHFSGLIITPIICFQGKYYTIESTPLVCSLWERRADGNITFIRDALHALLVCKQQTERHIMLTLLFNVSSFFVLSCAVISQLLSCSSGLPLFSHLSSALPPWRHDIAPPAQICSISINWKLTPVKNTFGPSRCHLFKSTILIVGIRYEPVGCVCILCVYKQKQSAFLLEMLNYKVFYYFINLFTF